MAQGLYINLPIWLVCLLLTAAAIIGNMVGYWIGYKAGPKLFKKDDSRFFKKEYVDKTHEFFEKYGNKAIVLARFVPIVRIVHHGYRRRRAHGLPQVRHLQRGGRRAVGNGGDAARLLPGQHPFVKDNIELILILVVLVSVIPIVFEYLKHRREKARAEVGQSS